MPLRARAAVAARCGAHTLRATDTHGGEEKQMERDSHGWVMALAAALSLGWPVMSSAQSEGGEEAGGDEAGKEEEPGTQELIERIEELEKKVAELEAQAGAGSQDELASLHAAADEEIGEDDDDEVAGQDESFHSGARALQALNPEITVTGDILGSLYMNKDFYLEEEAHEGHDHGHGIKRSGFALRAFELAFQSNLDPFSFAKFILGYHDETIHLEEGYISWSGAIPRVTLTLGRFFQQFGVINRWHEHALDQVDRPLVHQRFLSDHGLSGTGFSIRIMIPRAWAHAEELTIQVTNGENERLFAGEFFSIPSVLAHLKSYWDLNDSTYLELGLSGSWGVNNRRGYLDADFDQIRDEPTRHTVLAGADLSLVWAPAGREKYRGVAWRSEFLYLLKQDEHEGLREDFHAFGGFTYLDIRVSSVIRLGARFDVGQDPVEHAERWFWQAAPYVTFWQSEFVYLRLQYNATWWSDGHAPIHLLMLQANFSAGPHKHEKY